MNYVHLYRTIWGKCLIFIGSMILLSIAVFYISAYAPGDPLQSFYGERIENMQPAELEAARHRLGLDGPVYLRYISWVHNALGGDFGISLKYKESAIEVIRALVGVDPRRLIVYRRLCLGYFPGCLLCHVRRNVDRHGDL